MDRLTIDGKQYEPGEVVALVGCGKAKHTDAWIYEARNLYSSSFFGLKRDVAEFYGDIWYILSAKHGLVLPGTLLEPYDLALGDLEPSEKEEWGEQVADSLTDREAMFERSPATAIGLFAGSDYRDPLLRALPDEFPLEVVFPFEGMGLFEQMSYLSNSLPERDDEETTLNEWGDV